jgi:hypothetical protein
MMSNTTREQWLRCAVDLINKEIFDGDLDIENHEYQIACCKCSGKKLVEVIQPSDNENIGLDDFFPTTIHVNFTIKDPVKMLEALAVGCMEAFFNIKPKGKIYKETAKKYVIQLEKSIEIMKNYGVGDVITTFRNESGITGVPDGEITFYAALNEKPRFDNAVLVLALYSDNRLIEVSENFYWNLKNNDFTVMHASVNVPENKENLKIKAFIFDSLRNLRPIYEYKVIR